MTLELDATPDTIRAVAQVLKLAAILDDRAPSADKARIAAWSEQVQRYNLAETELVDGLQDFYDEPRDRAIGIGDLIAAARARKRTRIEREPDEHREARQAERDALAAVDVSDVAESLATGLLGGKPARSTPRYEAAKTVCAEFPFRPGGADTRTHEHQEAAKAAIRELFAAKAEAKKQHCNPRGTAA